MYIHFQEAAKRSGQMLSQHAEAVIQEKETVGLKRLKCHCWQYLISPTGLNIWHCQIERYWQTKWNFWNRNFQKGPCPSITIKSLQKLNSNSSWAHIRYGWWLLYSCILWSCGALEKESATEWIQRLIADLTAIMNKRVGLFRIRPRIFYTVGLTILENNEVV